MKPICIRCAVEMDCVENEFLVATTSTEGGPGTVYSGDAYECPICRARVALGFGTGSVVLTLKAMERSHAGDVSSR